MKIKEIEIKCACGDPQCKSLILINYYDNFMEAIINKKSIILYNKEIKRLIKFLGDYDG